MTRSTDRRTDLAVAAGLAVAALAFHWRLWLPAGQRWYFAGGDFVDQFYAFAGLEAAALAQGRLPLWNPFAYAGAPFWADVQAAVAYPPSLAVVLGSLAVFGYLPFVVLEAEAVAHVALAAIGTYLFARRVTRHRAAAVVSAVAFGGGGYLAGYPPLQLAVLESNAWLPWALLGVERSLAAAADPARRRPFDPVLPVALGMSILAGHPQSANYTLYAVAGYLAWRTRPWTAARGGPGRRPWLAAGAGLAGALGLSAAGWLPALQLLARSTRADASHALLSNGFPPRELLGAVVPGLTQWSPLYVGVVPLLLAAAAAWAALSGDGPAEAGGGSPGAGPSIEPRTDAGPAGLDGFWIALAGVALLLSLGRHGFAFDVFYHLAPGFDLFRGQERAAFLFSFGLAMLAGSGFRAWSARRPAALWAVTSGATAVAAVCIAVGVSTTAPAVREAAVRGALLAGAASVLSLARAQGRLRARAFAGAVVACIAVDLYAAGAHVNLVPAPPAELAVDPLVAALRAGATGRVHNEDRLPRNFGVLHGVEATSGASPLRLRTFDDLHGALSRSNERRLWDLLAVSDVLSWRAALDAPAERVAALGEGDAATYLHRLTAATPFVWRAVSAERVDGDAAALERLASPDFDPLATVLLHDGVPGGPAGRQSGVGNVVRRPGEVEAQTYGDGPGWLVFSEMHYPGWQATVDARPAPVLRADVALIAVPVPPGEHTVRLWFTAPWVGVGIAVSALSMAVVAGLAALQRRAGHAPRPGAGAGEVDAGRPGGGR